MFVSLFPALITFLIIIPQFWGITRDIDENCEVWAISGECNTSPGFMWNACIDSCEKFAKDDDERCLEWAKVGECVSNPKFVQIHCPVSCNAAIAWSHWLRRAMGLDELPAGKDLKTEDAAGASNDASILIGSSIDVNSQSLRNSVDLQGTDATSFKAVRASVIIPSDLLTSAYVLKQRLKGYLAGLSDVEGMSSDAAPNDFYGVLGLSQGFLYTLRLYGTILRSFADSNIEDVPELSARYTGDCDKFIDSIETSLTSSQMQSFSLYSEVKRWMDYVEQVEGHVHYLLELTTPATDISNVNIVPATVAIDVNGGDQFIDIQYRVKTALDVDVDGSIMPSVTVVSTSGATTLLENSITPNVYSMIGQYMTTELVFVNDTVASDPEVLRMHALLEDIRRQREALEEEVRLGKKLNAMEVVKQREQARVEAEVRRKMERVVLEKEREREKQKAKEAEIEAAKQLELEKQRAEKRRAENLKRAIERDLEKQRKEHASEEARRVELEAFEELRNVRDAQENKGDSVAQKKSVPKDSRQDTVLSASSSTDSTSEHRVVLNPENVASKAEAKIMRDITSQNTISDSDGTSSQDMQWKGSDSDGTSSQDMQWKGSDSDGTSSQDMQWKGPDKQTESGKIPQSHKQHTDDISVIDSDASKTVKLAENAKMKKVDMSWSEIDNPVDSKGRRDDEVESGDVEYSRNILSKSDIGNSNDSDEELSTDVSSDALREDTNAQDAFVSGDSRAGHDTSFSSDNTEAPPADEAIFEAEVDFVPRRKRGGRSVPGGPTVKLINGVRMPMIGFGTWQLVNESCVDAVKEAIKVGYRHIDTAQAYNNEDAVGVAISELIEEGVLTRNELFIATKISDPANGGYLQTTELVFNQIATLNCSYLDLYMIHSPMPHAVMQYETWRALEDLYKKRYIRAIGVSNFNTKQLKVLLNTARIAPMVVQNKYDIYHMGKQLDDEGDDIMAFTKSIGALMVAYSSFSAFPFVMKPLDDPVVRFISYKRSDWQWKVRYNNKHKSIKHSSKYDNAAMTPAQVLLRWTLQNGVAVIPRTSSVAHMHENFQASRIYPPLSVEDMQLLNSIHYFVSTPLTTAV